MTSRGTRQARWGLLAGCVAAGAAAAQPPVWAGYQGDAQHTGISSVASQEMQAIRWSTPVDENPQYSGNDLLAHYGSPLVTANNTVIVSVKTGATDGFALRGIDGATGALRWSQTTDYSLPAHNWTPSYSPTLTPTQRLYYAGAGGTVYYRDGVDGAATGAGQIAFYGNANYAANQAAFNQNVQISTPITSDALGNVFFGYTVSGSVTVNGSALQSGIARIAANGTGTFMAASAYDAGSNKVSTNSAPALSHDGQTVYFTVNNGAFGSGSLVAANAATLATTNVAQLFDPRGGGANRAIVPDDGTASPTVAPDGKVTIGVLEGPFTNSHGWLLQYSGNLATRLTPGAFGWDDTASIVPASMVAAMRAAGKYSGTSNYLLMAKYNDYGGTGGTGQNRLAILDPNDTQVKDGVTVMKEVETVLGLTPDPDFPGLPGAVREWCINAAAVDPFTNSVLVNSEDGKAYRWNLLTNSLEQTVTLTAGVGEAYTPTVIGADGTVYAINNGILFAIGTVPEPGTFALAGAFAGFAALRGWRRARQAKSSGRILA